MVTYAVPPQRRIALSHDFFSRDGLHVYAADLTQTPLTAAAADLLDSDAYSGTPVAIEAGGGLVQLFTGPVTVDAYLLDLITGTAPAVQITRDATPLLDGGAWLAVDAATLTPIADRRTPHVPDPLTAITGIRFHFTDAAEVGNLHLYGHSDSEVVTAVQLDGITAVSGSYADFGTGGKDGYSEVQFRIQNRGPQLDSYTLHFDVGEVDSTPSLADQIFVSVDGGVVFLSLRQRSSIPMPAISVGSLGRVVQVRRFAPADHDNLGPYSVEVRVETPGNGLDTSFRLYVGDADPAVAQPQLLDVFPARVPAGGTVEVTMMGVGATQAEFSSDVFLSSPGQVPYKLTSSGWSSVPANPAPAGDPAVVDVINHRARIFEPIHATATVQIPTDLESGHYQLLVLSSPGPDARLSGFQSLRVTSLPAEIPSTQDGVRLQATTMAGDVIAAHVPYTRLAFTDELSDVGSGKVWLDFSSPFWSGTPSPTLTADFIAENAFIWQVWEGNKLRFSFLNEVSDDSTVNAALSRSNSLQGEGIGSALRWSTIVPPRFPTVPPFYWTFTHARLWQWLTIWAECIKRTPINSIQRRFRPTFTRYADSAGTEWEDKGYENQQKNGVNMLELLEQHCDAIGADFHIEPNFRINVIYSRDTDSLPGKFYGDDRKQVVFRSALLKSKSVYRDRTEIGNWVLAQDDYGAVSLKFDSPSITKHGMRERYVEAGRSGYLTTRLSRASEDLKWHKDQVVSWTLAVHPYYEDSQGTIFNRVFVDYEVGDWIYVERGVSGSLIAVQVSAITMSVDASGAVEVELTLESLASLRRRKADLMENSSNSGSGSGGSLLVLFEDHVLPVTGTPPTKFEVKYLPLPESEIITLGMKKYMEVDGTGALGVREFTRRLRRGVHWERTGWEIKILDPTIFDEAF